MRVTQPIGARGSLKWLQRAVEFRPDLLQPVELPKIKWVSPVADDGFAEYRDAAFLERIGEVRLAPDLADFWPKRGPQWDALGLADGLPILVEAKAHLGELRSPGTAASSESRAKIERAFVRVQKALGMTEGPIWTSTYYQYANRLAHLWWLRANGVDAKLLFVSFLGDIDMQGPSTVKVWEDAFKVADAALGIPTPHELTPHVMHIYPDVSVLDFSTPHP